MAMESLYGQMDLSLKAISKMIRLKGKDYSFGLTKNHIMENGIIIKWKAEEFFFGLMEEDMRDHIKMILNKVLGN